MKKSYRIPTILGFLILFVSIGAGVLLVRQGPIWILRAGPEITPKQVKITNISENGFTVSWVTDGQTSGFVKYGTEINLITTIQDDRDQLSGKTGSFLTHHITLNNLKPATNYYFKISSGGKLFDNNGQPYQTTTASSIQTPLPPSDVAYGMVIDQNGAPVEGTIVYLSLANTTPLSTLTKSSGSWVIPLNLARSIDLISYASYDRQASIEEIFVQAGVTGTSTAVTVAKNDSPVPTITLGRSFDFRTVKQTPEESTATLTPTPAESKFSEITPPSTSTVSTQLTITNPDQGDQVNTQKPEILGTGPSGKILKIVINSPETFTAQVTINKDGTWSWTPPTNLSPGTHTITVSLTDGTKVSHSFTVLAAGSSQLPALTATPSATATPSPTPTATSAGRVSRPSTEGGVPTSGYLTPTFFVFIMGVVLMFLGLLTNILLKKM
ncbi:hypothetical protein CO054_00210 [Candidatus Shapirobacteria bacterium CG_4_9_14_0_2_um_filter_39_11]|uniref:Fibronectin type-III domain-containing protein n=1 Tax=Candidatus Shapirobacteria bacterium CG_4_9_14_0_2_um_filter_39_11 TaxID=1974478 RepID=A0A2M8ETI2_9BACT|nr:MAG: hypothetical protein CO054_00210 [Candidatus Shapirobacteria bacterium CG_4_9_14_0_2_um_filter_39_11]